MVVALISGVDVPYAGWLGGQSVEFTCPNLCGACVFLVSNGTVGHAG